MRRTSRSLTPILIRPKAAAEPIAVESTIEIAATSNDKVMLSRHAGSSNRLRYQRRDHPGGGKLNVSEDEKPIGNRINVGAIKIKLTTPMNVHR